MSQILTRDSGLKTSWVEVVLVALAVLEVTLAAEHPNERVQLAIRAKCDELRLSLIDWRHGSRALKA